MGLCNPRGVDVLMPTGTVTFLFTDVVGSTRAWASDRLGMSASLRQHDAVLRSAFENHHGYVFATGGDGFGVAFPTASSAVAACESVQRRLGEVKWEAGPALQVRMGLHLGEAEERGGDYFGPAVNTAARIGAAAHGGQVVMSEQVRAAAGLQVEAIDLGTVRLRDVPEPVRVFQIGAGAHPPLRSADKIDSTLPRMRTDLVGRDEAVRDVGALLLENRLVTLTAVGGAGKTRVALEVARRSLDEGADAAFFVDLSTIANEAEVGAAIASGLAFIPSPTGAVAPQVRDWIGARPALLVIDNCEHVIDEVAEQTDLLLSACPNVTILTTSREALDLEGEVVFRLEPLSTFSSPGELSPAARLFRQRAADRGVSLADGVDHVDVVNELCARLDGLPLAIELAAARTAALSPAQILARLDDRFALLTSRRRRTAARQQTLAATIGWSFDQLESEEQILLACLSVFPSGFDLDGVEAVGKSDPSFSLELIESLIAKSLVQPAEPHREAKRARYRLLETVRDFAHQHLARDPAALQRARHRYAIHIASRVAALAPWAFAPLSEDLELLADDLIPAMEIADAAGDYELVCRLASDAFPLWALLGKHGEADAWIALAEPHLDSRTLSQGLAARWGFSHWLPGRAGQAPRATRRAVECHPIEDQPWGWFTLMGQGLNQYIGHPEQAERTLRQARYAIEWANDPDGAAEAINWLEGLMHLWKGDYARAVALYGIDMGLDQEDLLLAPFRLTGTLYANYLGDRHEGNAELLDNPSIRRVREHWFNYGHRGAQNVLSVEVAAGIAAAGLGDVHEAARLIKQAHDELGHTLWPRLPADFVLGVAALRLASNDRDGARRALDAFALGRYPESQPLGYRLIALTDQWSSDDWPGRAVDEVRHRLTRRSEAQWDELANQLITTELDTRR